VSDPFFLSVEDVEDIHAESLDRFVGTGGIRDRGLLESAVAGIDLEDPEERLYEAMMAVASRSLDENGLAALMRDLAGQPAR
jgi:prophage maintenance system killer protein